MPTKFWDELYKNRLDWAEKAYSEFMRSIDEDISSEFERQGEITVVLYGRTQVGKTTLLLKILGISGQQFNHVSDVLRGGRNPGKSATSTAIRYGRSSDDCWRIGSVDSRSLDHKEVERLLAEMRENVESGRYVVGEPVNIFIPSCYFSDESSLLRVRVLDLPGTGASNKNERSHVYDLAKRYVPAADLVLLVGKSDNLGFLQPDNLGIDELAMWQYAPDRFRIVLTHTFSSQSTKEWVLKGGELSVSSIRNYALSQILTHDYELRDEKRFLECLYPVEFGRSWDGLRCDGDKVFSRAEPVVDELFELLSNDIKASATKYARIRSAFSLQAAVIEKANREKRAADETLALAEKALDDIVFDLCFSNARVATCKKSCAELTKKKETLINNFENDIKELEKLFSGSPGRVAGDEKRVSVIFEYISGEKIKLKRNWRKFSVGLKMEEVRKDFDAYPAKGVDGFFVNVERALQGHNVDKYFFSNNYNSDLDAARNAVGNASFFLSAYGAEILRGCKNRGLKKFGYRIKKLEREISDISARYESQLEDVLMALDRLDEMGLEGKKREESYAIKIKRSNDFNLYLESSFRGAIAENLALISGAKLACEKFLILCLMSVIEDDFKKFKEGV